MRLALTPPRVRGDARGNGVLFPRATSQLPLHNNSLPGTHAISCLRKRVEVNNPPQTSRNPRAGDRVLGTSPHRRCQTRRPRAGEGRLSEAALSKKAPRGPFGAQGPGFSTLTDLERKQHCAGIDEAEASPDSASRGSIFYRATTSQEHFRSRFQFRSSRSRP